MFRRRAIKAAVAAMRDFLSDERAQIKRISRLTNERGTFLLVDTVCGRRAVVCVDLTAPRSEKLST